jgi:transcriptional regulator with XRE-family HTH domain
MMDVPQSNLNGGKLLAELRRRYELTQAELAKRAAISRSMVAQLEIGERWPSQKLIRTLCSAMNAAADEERQLLLAYEFRPTGETPEQIAAFLRADKNLTLEQAERIANLVRKAYEKEFAAEEERAE